MKAFIAFVSLNLSLLLFSSSVASAQSNYWQMTLCSGKKIIHFSFGNLSKDSLSLIFAETRVKVPIDSIKEIRRVRKSHVLLGMGIGSITGILLGAILVPKQDSDKPTHENPLEEELDDIGRGFTVLGALALGTILGVITGAIVGASMGEDEVHDFSGKTLSSKRGDIELIIKREKFHQNKDKTK
ncbi:hypothetical protein B6D60_06685 [candidate division KSB1 bacterium 4484_87]|nr:MAG: hypothetical protein B6D60_06685 [candidate division KSB1 bacterium 4484_87]